MKRRDFLKAAAGGATLALSGGAAQARENKQPLPEAMGLLYDSTLCIGCKACVVKCKQVNGMPPEIRDGNPQYDSARDLSDKTLLVIKTYENGNAEQKDRETDGFAFERRACMHCVDPGCVSVCPVTAMRQHPVTGIVSYHADACIGCRNCTLGCPYSVPQFEYNNPLGQIRKCQLCNQKGVERIDQGMMTGCSEVCPTGATLFGKRKDLMAEARRRLALKPGEIYSYPRGSLSDPFQPHEKPAPTYLPQIWGEKEAGGTNVMHVAGVHFDKLGMPPLGERSAASIAEGVQHGLYSYLALPAIALAGLTYVVHRNNDDDQSKGGE